MLPPLRAGEQGQRASTWRAGSSIRDNPLTARVTVNWVWHKYFGRGLVATLEDFGTQGEKPSHPELLDWLASEFVPAAVEPEGAAPADRHLGDLSAVVAGPAGTGGRDPLNVLLARQARLRLEAEILRDVAAGGQRPADDAPSAARASGRRSRPGISELTYAGSAAGSRAPGRTAIAAACTPGSSAPARTRC